MLGLLLAAGDADYPDTPPRVTQGEPDLYPPRAPLAPTWWERERGTVLAAGVMLAAVAGLGIWLWSRRQPDPVPPAHAVVRQKLREWPLTGLDPAQLGALARDTRRFVQLRLGWGDTALTTDEWAQRAEADDRLPGPLRQELIDTLRRCDRCRFGPAPTTGTGELGAQLLGLAEAVEQAMAQEPQGSPGQQPVEPTRRKP